MHLNDLNSDDFDYICMGI